MCLIVGLKLEWKQKESSERTTLVSADASASDTSTSGQVVVTIRPELSRFESIRLGRERRKVSNSWSNSGALDANSAFDQLQLAYLYRIAP